MHGTPLHTEKQCYSWLHAATVGDIQTLRRLSRQYPNISDCSDSAGDTALHRAAAHGRLLALRVLCDINPHILYVKNKEGHLPEDRALRKHHPKCAAYLTEKTKAVTIEERLTSYRNKAHKRYDVKNLQPLHIAALHGDIEAAEYILLKNPQALEECGKNTPAHIAAEAGFSRFILLMREYDPMIMTRLDDRGRTPGHCALRAGQDKTLRVLIRFIPDMADAKDACGSGVRESAEIRGRHKLANFLRKRAEHFAFRDRLHAYAAQAAKEGSRHMLDIAAEAGDMRALRLILARYPHLPAYEDAAKRALNVSADRGDTEMISLLLEKFPLLTHYLDKDGTPLRLAAAQDRREAMKLLLNMAPSALHTADRYGNTALHEAARRGHKIIAGLCIHHQKRSLFDVNRFGATPAHVAAHHGHAHVLELCEKYAPASLRVRDHDGWNAADYAAHANKDTCLDIAERCGCSALYYKSADKKEQRRFIIRRKS